MAPLLVLALVLLLIWGFGVWERDSRAAFMRDWLHVPLIAGIIALIMGIISAFLS